MTLLYNIGIRIYYSLVLIASVFNPKAKLWIQGRKDIFQNLEKLIDKKDRYAWFHASSLGEFEQGRPIMEALRKDFPEVKIILTFFSPSGYEVRKNYQGADVICYLPLDTKKNARRFINCVNPKWIFFIKYEYWYHYLKTVKQSKGQLFLISGIFRPNQLFFKWYGGWYRQMLTWFDMLFVQNSLSADLLESIKIKNHVVAGDSRFDRVVQIAAQGKDIEPAKIFAQEKKVIVAGSTWPADEDILFHFIQQSPDNIKLILAPHEIKKEHIDDILSKIKVPYVLFSSCNDRDLKNARILIIDNIGMLSSIYKYGQIAYIGGGFGVGIHNTIEAAVYGIPVIFGPNYQKFQEAKDLISCSGGFSFREPGEFLNLMNAYLMDEGKLSVAGKAAGDYVSGKVGTTDIVINYLKKNSVK